MKSEPEHTIALYRREAEWRFKREISLADVREVQKAANGHPDFRDMNEPQDIYAERLYFEYTATRR